MFNQFEKLEKKQHMPKYKEKWAWWIWPSKATTASFYRQAPNSIHQGDFQIQKDNIHSLDKYATRHKIRRYQSYDNAFSALAMIDMHWVRGKKRCIT